MYSISRFILSSLFLLALSVPADAQQRLNVVTSFPDLADMARRIGGDFVDVTSIAKGVEDPHSIPMKPSYVVLLNRADIVIVQGFDLEHAFLPGLLDAARNEKIIPGAAGYIDCSKYVQPLNVPQRLDRSLGEQHPLGNPHFNLDPVAGKAMAKAIQEGLSRNFPQQDGKFKENLAGFTRELDSQIEQWTKAAASLRGVKYVSYHPDFEYFAARFGMIPAGTIEVRAGVDATPSHITSLEELMKKQEVSLVIREKHYPAELAATIAEATGARLIELPIMSGGVPEATDYIHLIDYIVSKTVAAVAERK